MGLGLFAVQALPCPNVHTCELSDANPFDYPTEFQRHAEELHPNRQNGLPWNYREMLAPADITANPRDALPPLRKVTSSREIRT